MCLAVPGELLEVEGAGIDRVGKVSFGGVIKRVSLAYMPEAQVGDYVIVHVGFALSVVDAEEAQRVFAYLDQMGELAELEDGEFDPLAAAPAGFDLDDATPPEMLDLGHVREVMA